MSNQPQQINVAVYQSEENTPAHAYLGLATTEELIEELRTRIELDYYRGGGGLRYTTVHGRPDSNLTTRNQTEKSNA